MTRRARKFLEVVCWIIACPPVLLAFFNPDVGALGLGAFGPPAATTLTRWLIVAVVTCGALALANRSGRMIALCVTAVFALAVVRFREREVLTEDVRFSSGQIHYAATVYRPKNSSANPAVVFVHGSAPLKRGFYSLWAEHLAKRGVVAIVADKRGVGGTSGVFDNTNNTSRANLDLLAGDAVVTARYAASLPGVDPTRIGLIGLSQGGWTVPMAALRSGDVHFMILMTGPAVSVYEEGVWSDLRGDDQSTAKYSRKEAERIIDSVAIRGVDPRPRLAALNIPGLWLYGSDDNSMPAGKSMRVLDSLARGGKRYKAVSFDGAGHLVFKRKGGLLPHVVPAMWDSLDNWIAAEIRR